VSELTIIGGFYRESCRFPRSDEFWGSGGRAAAAVKNLPFSAKLFTAADERSEEMLATIAQTVGFDYRCARIPKTITFRYDHGLSTPIIWPPLNEIGAMQMSPQGECVLQFGMLEAEVQVQASTVIYDPQEPFSPKHFHGANKPRRLAYVLNGTEARRLGNSEDVEIAARTIMRESAANVVIVKRGAKGALVLVDGETHVVPAYEATSVWPIGSGDVFAAIFAARWGVQALSAVEAADDASRSTAHYVAHRTLPIPLAAIEDKSQAVPLKLSRTPAGGEEYDVYLAGPFFNMAQLWLIDEAWSALKGMGLRVFSPFHDIGPGPGSEVAPKDIEALERSRAVLAILDGTDTGTVFEAGFARARNRPVVAFAQSTPEEPLKMISGTGCEVVKDFVSALYRVAWAAWR
jgi:hypothetical protein